MKDNNRLKRNIEFQIKKRFSFQHLKNDIGNVILIHQGNPISINKHLDTDMFYENVNTIGITLGRRHGTGKQSIICILQHNVHYSSQINLTSKVYGNIKQSTITILRFPDVSDTIYFLHSFFYSQRIKLRDHFYLKRNIVFQKSLIIRTNMLSFDCKY